MRFMPGTKRTRPRDVGEASARLVAQTEAARRAIHGGDIVIDPFPFKMGRETDHGDNARDANDAELVEVRTNSGLQISRTHLQIEFEHGRYFVRDRHSACGTIVNGQRIGGNHTGGRLEVRDGDVMVLGGTTSPFVFTFVTEPRVSDAILATTGSRAAEPQQPGSPEVVLVVDDDEAVRGLMRLPRQDPRPRRDRHQQRPSESLLAHRPGQRLHMYARTPGTQHAPGRIDQRHRDAPQGHMAKVSDPSRVSIRGPGACTGHSRARTARQAPARPPIRPRCPSPAPPGTLAIPPSP